MKELPRFVYISSSMIYCDFEKVPMPEGSRREPKWVCGSRKLASEITRVLPGFENVHTPLGPG